MWRNHATFPRPWATYQGKFQGTENQEAPVFLRTRGGMKQAIREEYSDLTRRESTRIMRGYVLSVLAGESDLTLAGFNAWVKQHELVTALKVIAAEPDPADPVVSSDTQPATLPISPLFGGNLSTTLPGWQSILDGDKNLPIGRFGKSGFSDINRKVVNSKVINLGFGDNWETTLTVYEYDATKKYGLRNSRHMSARYLKTFEEEWKETLETDYMSGGIWIRASQMGGVIWWDSQERKWLEIRNDPRVAYGSWTSVPNARNTMGSYRELAPILGMATYKGSAMGVVFLPSLQRLKAQVTLNANFNHRHYGYYVTGRLHDIYLDRRSTNSVIQLNPNDKVNIPHNKAHSGSHGWWEYAVTGANEPEESIPDGIGGQVRWYDTTFDKAGKDIYGELGVGNATFGARRVDVE